MTKLKSFNEEGVQFAWDASSLSAYAKCPRYYELRYLNAWQPDAQSVHLLFGGWYAKALEDYFKYCALGNDKETALRKIIHETLIATWTYDTEPTGEGDPGFPDGVNIIRGTGKPWESLHNTKTRETLIRSIVWYFAHFEQDTTETVHLADGQPAVEYSFALPFADGIVYCGHMDRLVTYGDDYFVMDQKTSGTTITQRYFESFSPDFQMSGYSYAGKILFDLPISGVIIDAAQIAVGFTRFERGFVHRGESQLEEWRENVLHLIDRAQQDTKNGYFPRNYASCGNYGNCEFRRICSRATHHQDNLLRADFHKGKRWDPLEQR